MTRSVLPFVRALVVALVLAAGIFTAAPPAAHADDIYVSDIANAVAGAGDPIEAIAAFIETLWDALWG